ncbi:MAG: hypothetical protein LUG60_01585 [Erysipelotrichaceae bacterium]|nr:hypothetical protein [Erysipelotrichaceae bacterium]
MKLKYGSKNLIIDKNTILLFYIFLVIASKIVRYTIMKTTLVDAARGDEILYLILHASELKFKFSLANDSIAFNNAAVIFKFLNVFKLSTYTQFEIYITVIWNIITFILIYNLDRFKNNIQSFYVILTIAILNIFNYTIAKEPIQILYFFLIYYFLNSRIFEKIKFPMCILTILFSTVTFRSYYILFAVFSIALLLMFQFFFKNNKKLKLSHVLFIILVISLIYFCFINVAKILFPESYAELIRVRLVANDANSSIRAILPNATSNTIYFTLDYIIQVFRLIFPVELLKMGGKYIIFVLYQILVTYFLIKRLLNYKNNTKTQNYALFLYIAFILMSASFEPDFGSWVRHEAVAFPIMLIIAGINTKKGRMKTVNEWITKKI